MSITINAWLERKNPILELKEDFTNRNILRIEGERLQDWLDSGVLALPDLQSSQASLQELVKDLLINNLADPVRQTGACQNNVVPFPDYPIIKTLLKKAQRFSTSKNISQYKSKTVTAIHRKDN